MSAQFTPGPWAVSKNSSGRRVTTDKGVVICNAVLRNSGSAKRGLRYGAKDVLEAEANARLIASCPELLGAMEIIRAALSQYSGCVSVLGDLFKVADAAIANATIHAP